MRTTLARPYAKAAFGLARDSGALDRWHDMLDLASAIAGDRIALPVCWAIRRSPAQTVSICWTAAGGDRFDERFKGFSGRARRQQSSVALCCLRLIPRVQAMKLGRAAVCMCGSFLRRP